MLKKALDHSKIESNLIRKAKPLEENNVHERELCKKEIESLFVHYTASLKGIVLIAYNLPMSQGEILDFTWEEIDLKTGFIRLRWTPNKKQNGEDDSFASTYY